MSMIPGNWMRDNSDMSITPRTDAAQRFVDGSFVVPTSFACELERENTSLYVALAVLGYGPTVNLVHACQDVVRERDESNRALADLHAKDAVRTKEHNLLVQENRTLRDGLTLIANGGEAADSIAKLTLREATQPLSQ